jgi:hypothetical protein
MTTIEDIDGTNGRAAAALLSVVIDLSVEHGEATVKTTDVFTEEDYASPLDTAHNLKASVKDDFPDRIFTVVANERANFLRWKGLMDRIIGGRDNDYEAYLEASK